MSSVCPLWLRPYRSCHFFCVILPIKDMNYIWEKKEFVSAQESAGGEGLFDAIDNEPRTSERTNEEKCMYGLVMCMYVLNECVCIRVSHDRMEIEMPRIPTLPSSPMISLCCIGGSNKCWYPRSTSE